MSENSAGTSVGTSLIDRVRRIERNVGLIKYYSSFKMPDGRYRIKHDDLIEQVKCDAKIVEDELSRIRDIWKQVKPLTEEIA
jgi:ASC-1-like (ASCH) protein